MNNLNADYFSDYKEEFWFIKNHLDQFGNIPDLTTFANMFPSFEIFQVNENLNYLLEELIKDKNKRFLAENYNKMRNYILNNDIESAMQLLREASEKSTTSVSLQTVDILHDTSRYEAYLERTENYDKYFIKTGFEELDAILGGWDVTEELATIVARPGIGKSWIVLKCAVAAAMQGKKVGIYSGEMSENKVGYRIDTLLGHFSNGALIHGSLSVKNDYKKYLDSLSEKVPGSIVILTPKMINGLASVSALRAFMQKENLDILFVDQYSLLDDERGGKSDSEKTANIVKDLKTLQVLMKKPIICVSQQNRETSENGYGTQLVALTDKIPQYSTVLIFLERKDNDLMKMHLIKSRDTENGKVLTYRVDFNTGMFQYINEDPNVKTVDSNDVEYTDDEVF